MWFDRSAGIVLDLVELGDELTNVEERGSYGVKDPDKKKFWVVREGYSPAEDDMVDESQAECETVASRL